ncbi:MAG: hypothetical protein ACK53Y_23120, partial [bacterium]
QGAGADLDRRLRRQEPGTFRRGGTRAATAAAQVPRCQASLHGFAGSERGSHRLGDCSGLSQAVANGDLFQLLRGRQALSDEIQLLSRTVAVRPG